MTEQLQKHIDYLLKTFEEMEHYANAAHVLNFDLETICPKKAMEHQGETAAFLSNQAFKLTKAPEFIEASEYLWDHRDELDNDFQQSLAFQLHMNQVRTKNITPEMDREFSMVFQKAYIDWLEAKESSDFSKFAPSLKAVRDTQLKQLELWTEKQSEAYNNLLDEFERGMTMADLDAIFGECKDRLIPLLKKIMASKKNIRTDFLSRKVTDAQQAEFSRYLLEIMGFDFTRGAFTTTEHPFTDGLAKDDIRVTTHYYPNAFTSSMYSIIHEGGHALFEMFQPAENYIWNIDGGKTMGQHESVSRFYENIIGRSREYIHLVYPKAKEIFAEQLADVSEEELYEAVNTVTPSLIRTESDEFTYTFHIIIRYELEKAIIAGELDIAGVPAAWNKKYEEYLGVTPANDAEGCLQDVHWSGNFGYFPAYAIGNFYNAMYWNKMKEEFDVAAAVRSGDFAKINGWMTEHVWKKADRLAPKEWIQEITGRTITAKDFLDYLETKYSTLYEL